MGVLNKIKEHKKMAIILGTLIFLVSLYLGGIFTQASESKVAYKHTAISFNPFICIASGVTSGYSWLILGLIIFCAIAGCILLKIKKEEGSSQDERNFNRSAKGTYGTSGWMTNEELKKILMLSPLNKNLSGDIGTILGLIDGKVVSLPLKSRLNKHTAIYGASGTGKSRCFVRPQILQCVDRGESIIITDPKGEIYADTAKFMKNEGYDVKVFNLVDPTYSDSWNCLQEINKTENSKELMAQTFAEVVIKNTMQGGKADHFWDNAEMNLLKSLVLIIAMDEHREGTSKNIGAAYELLTSKDEKQLDAMFDRLPASHPAKQPYGIFKQSSESVRGNVIVGLGARLQVFQSDIIRKITTYDEIDLEKPARQKCGYFVIMSDQDSTLDFLSSLFFSFLFIRLVRYADIHGKNGACDVPVNFILDEFPNIGSIPDFTKKLSTIRSRDLRVAVIFQNLAQLQNRYPMGLWEEIVGNCDTQLFLGCTDQMTSKFISDRTGEMTIDVVSSGVQKQSITLVQSIPSYRENQSVGKRVVLTPDEVLRLPNNNALVIIRGQKILKVDKFDYSKHPNQNKFDYENIRNHIPDWRANQVDGRFNDKLDLKKKEEVTNDVYNQVIKDVVTKKTTSSQFGPSHSQFSTARSQFGGNSQFKTTNKEKPIGQFYSVNNTNTQINSSEPLYKPQKQEINNIKNSKPTESSSIPDDF